MPSEPPAFRSYSTEFEHREIVVAGRIIHIIFSALTNERKDTVLIREQVAVVAAFYIFKACYLKFSAFGKRHFRIQQSAFRLQGNSIDRYVQSLSFSPHFKSQDIESIILHYHSGKLDIDSRFTAFYDRSDIALARVSPDELCLLKIFRSGESCHHGILETVVSGSFVQIRIFSILRHRPGLPV